MIIIITDCCVSVGISDIPLIFSDSSLLILLHHGMLNVQNYGALNAH